MTKEFDHPASIELEVNVTRDDIENGFRGNADVCPIALAVNRALKEKYGDDNYWIEVDGNIYFTIDASKYDQYDHKKETCEFTQRYDAEDYVSPFKTIIKFFVEEEEDYYYDN